MSRLVDVLGSVSGFEWRLTIKGQSDFGAKTPATEDFGGVLQNLGNLGDVEDVEKRL